MDRCAIKGFSTAGPNAKEIVNPKMRKRNIQQEDTKTAPVIFPTTRRDSPGGDDNDDDDDTRLDLNRADRAHKPKRDISRK